MWRRSVGIWAALGLTVGWLVPAGAVAASEGRLVGTVRTIDGARVPGVTIVLEAEGGTETRRLASGADGRFRSGPLAAGRWRITAELSGLSELVRAEVTLAPGEEQRVELTLALPLFAESITAAGEMPRDSLEASRLRESAARDVGEALAELPGLWKLRKGGIANEVVLRGLQSRDLAILVDGQPLHGACPNKMDPAAFHVDFAEVERIEVTKGPFDLRRQGALGGTVNVLTRAPSPGWSAHPELALGSAGFWNPALSAGWGGERISVLAGGSQRRSDPYRDGRGERVTEVAAYAPVADGVRAFDLTTGWSRLGASLTDRATLDLAYSAQRSDTVLYPYLAMDARYDDADRLRLRYQATGLGAANLSLGAQASWAAVEHGMDDRLRTSALGRPRAYSMSTWAETVTSGLALEVSGAGWTAGLETSRRSWDACNRMAMGGYAEQAMIPDVEVDVAGLYVEATRSLAAWATLTAGARLDAAESRADAARAPGELYERYHGTRSLERRDLLPAGQVRLALQRDGLRAAIGLGHAARVPEATERYLGLVRMASDWVGDPQLEPSRNTGGDVELGWEGEHSRVGLAVYAQWIEDYVTVVQVAAKPAAGGGMMAMPKLARSFANVDAEIFGVEVTASTSLGERLFLAGDLSWLRGERGRLAGAGSPAGALAEMPAPTARLSARWDDGRWFAELEQILAARQRRVDSTLGEEETPSWAATHARLGWRGARLTATLGVANLFDRHFTEHLSFQRDPFRSGVRVPEPGRALSAALGYRF